MNDDSYLAPASTATDEATVRPTNVRYLVLAALCVITVIAYVQRSCINVAAERIRADLGLSLEETGSLMSAFYLGYALFQIPSGLLRDRWGTRRALPLFAATWSLSCALMALAGSAHSLIGLWFICGLAQAGIFPCAVNSLVKWLPATRTALGCGVLTSFMSIGTIIASSLTGPLLSVVDWHTMFLLYAAPGLAWAAWFVGWFRESPQQHPAVNAAELALLGPVAECDRPNASVAPQVTAWAAILSSPAMWAICGQQFFRAAGYVFYATWFPTFLREARGVSLIDAGLLTSLPVLAYVVASTLGGGASDWLLIRTGSRRISRQVFASVCMLACALFILFAYPIQDPLSAVLVISAGSFWAAFGGSAAYPVTMEMGGRNVTTVFSIMNMVGNIGAFLFPIVLAWLVTLTGQWNVVFFLFAGIYCAAAGCWLAFNPYGIIGEDRHTTSRSG